MPRADRLARTRVTPAHVLEILAEYQPTPLTARRIALEVRRKLSNGTQNSSDSDNEAVADALRSLKAVKAVVERGTTQPDPRGGRPAITWGLASDG